MSSAGLAFPGHLEPRFSWNACARAVLAIYRELV